MASAIWFGLLVIIINIILLIEYVKTDDFEFMKADERESLKEEARDMFYHAYNAYMSNAYPADELMPLSCKGRYRGTESDRGDIDSTLGNFSLTLVDTLDTLVVLGDLEEFENAVKLVVRDVKFDTDVIVSLFETNIRVLGGLLSGHILSEYLQVRADIMPWYRGELLNMAKDLGYRFLPAFNTTTGIPYGRINLRSGMKNVPAEMCRETCTACAGSMILEMAALSRLTGEGIFEEKAQKAMDALWKMRHRGTDLMGSVLNVHSGDWVRRDSGVGAGIDSYYEYCLKAYILLGDEKYLGRFNRHYSAVMKYVSQGPMLLDVHMHRPNTNSKNFMDALLAFWPGLQVLKGDIKPAVETHEMLYQVLQRHNFIPEAFTTDFQVHWGHHPLRPEFLESTYYLYRATGDHYYLGVGRKVLKSLQTYARVPCGYAAVSDVRTNKHDDTMESFVLSETFKYLYLLFAESSDLVLDIDEFIFTTEGHLLPLTLASLRANVSSDVDIDTVELDELDRTCPNSLHLFPASVRKPLRNMVEDVCPRRSMRRRISAAQFQANNLDHLKILSSMGITVLTMADGRMQLLHTFSNAKSMEDAEEGLIFMQEMVELNRKQTQESDKQRLALMIRRTDIDKESILLGGPAQFGLQLTGSVKVTGKPVLTEPKEACSELTNVDMIKGNIAVIFRGNCMFIEKARMIEKAGAIGGIVLDTVIGSTIATSAMFAMSGDGISKDDIKIPLSFLFNVEANELVRAISESNGAITVTMGNYVVDKVDKNESDDYLSMFERLKSSVKDFLTRPSQTSDSTQSTISAPALDSNKEEMIIDKDHIRAIIPHESASKNKQSRDLVLFVKLLINKNSPSLSTSLPPTSSSSSSSSMPLPELSEFEKGWRVLKQFLINRIYLNTKFPPYQVVSISRIEIYYDWMQKERNPKNQVKSDELSTFELVTWFIDELSDTFPNFEKTDSFNSISGASKTLMQRLKTSESNINKNDVINIDDNNDDDDDNNDSDSDKVQKVDKNNMVNIMETYKIYDNLMENIQDVLKNLKTEFRNKNLDDSNSNNNNDKNTIKDNKYRDNLIVPNYINKTNQNELKEKITDEKLETDSVDSNEIDVSSDGGENNELIAADDSVIERRDNEEKIVDDSNFSNNEENVNNKENATKKKNDEL
ncbi:ER degradation-enhancing alpha-mannosidase-like protein 3 [Microplitis mediator]|uniref:ER degradation-enhancing alpha-mannosidase-like protein 3 n=1 Tax=Microplitis mediator TaxID=375433 RepID=UPI002552409B|nr:ER degradation-enhancing alpha-mannosidase-like protein 3 [Microplitis mediator]